MERPESALGRGIAIELPVAPTGPPFKTLRLTWSILDRTLVYDNVRQGFRHFGLKYDNWRQGLGPKRLSIMTKRRQTSAGASQGLSEHIIIFIQRLASG